MCLKKYKTELFNDSFFSDLVDSKHSLLSERDFFKDGFFGKDKFVNKLGGIKKVKDTDDEVVFSIDVFGLEKDEIKVTIKEFYLIIEGKHSQKREEEGIKEKKIKKFLG